MKQKRFPALALITLAICGLLFFPDVAAARPPIPPGSPIGAAAAIVYDMDNETVLFEHNADAPIPPASLTKVMSMFLALDHVKQGKATLDDSVTVSSAAASTGGSLMGLRSGEVLPLKRLLLGMAVSSGNDASHAVAEYVGGTAETFVKRMNEKAAALGMTNSHFKNPHGLPANGQQVSARDMAILALAYLRAHPESLEMHNTRTLTHGGYATWNKNPLLGQYEGADGLKSGWIRASGHNLIFTAKRGGKRLLGVILGATDANWRGAEACRLLDAGFQVCSNEAVSVAAALENIPVDLNRVDILKTARDAGIKKRPVYSKRLLAARKALRLSSGAPYSSSLPRPKSVAKKGSGKQAKAVAKNTSNKKATQAGTKRKSHAARGQRQARRG